MSEQDKSLAVVAHTVPTRVVVENEIAVLDTATFDQMYRVAKAMSAMSLVPTHLQNKEADCFLIVNQAVRWGFDPFAVAAATSVIGGRIMYEGKLVHAAINAKLNIRLNWRYEGEEETPDRKIIVFGKFPDEANDREISGKVKNWKTTRNGSPWTEPAGWDRMLVYRGCREWVRLHAPEVILGVYTPDEYDRNVDDPMVQRQRVSEKLKGGNGDGFQHDHVMNETAQEPEKPKRGRPKATPAEEVAQDGVPGEPEQAENATQLTDAEVVDEIAETPKEEVNQEVTEDGPQATQTEDAGSVTAQNGNQSEAQDMESAQSAENHREIAGESDVSRSDAFEAFNAQVDQAKSWAEIDAAFMALYTTEDWKFAEEWERRATRVTMWTRVEALRTETKSIIIDPRDNAKAFLCWLECVKEGEESKVNMLFKQLQATPTYKKFNDEQRAHIENQVKGALERIGKK